jgi:hypothetical protein
LCADDHHVTPSTGRAATAARLRRAGPIAGLALTVTIGTLVGVWMALSAVLATAQTDQAGTSGQGHASSPGAGHVDEHAHSDAGLVAMPGLEPVAPPLPAADPMAGMSAEDMAGMVQAPPVAATPSPIAADPMAGMSAEDMVAHSTDAHDAEGEPGESGRPLGATLAGFGVVNLGVLLAAVLIARRRASHRPGPRTPHKRPTRRPATAKAASSTSTTEPAGSPS